MAEIDFASAECVNSCHFSLIKDGKLIGKNYSTFNLYFDNWWEVVYIVQGYIKVNSVTDPFFRSKK